MTVEDHLNDPDFQKLPPEAQIEILKQADPDFANFVNSRTHKTTTVTQTDDNAPFPWANEKSHPIGEGPEGAPATQQPHQQGPIERFIGINTPLDIAEQGGGVTGGVVDPGLGPLDAIAKLPSYLGNKLSKAFSAITAQPSNQTPGQELAESIPFIGDAAEQYNQGDLAGAAGTLFKLGAPSALEGLGKIAPKVAKSSMMNILNPGTKVAIDQAPKFDKLTQFMLDNPEWGWTKGGLYKNQKAQANNFNSALENETPNFIQAAQNADRGVSFDKSYENLDALRQKGVNRKALSNKPNDFSKNITNPADAIRQQLDESELRITDPNGPDIYPETDVENAINTRKLLDEQGDWNPTILSDPSVPYAAKAARAAANGVRENLGNLAQDLGQHDWIKANDNLTKSLGVQDQLGDSLSGRVGQGSNLPQETAGVGLPRAIGRSFKDVWQTTPLQLMLGHGANAMTSVLPNSQQANMARLMILANQINQHTNGGR